MAGRLAYLRQSDFTAAQWTAITNNALAFKELTTAHEARVNKVFPGTPQQIAQQVIDDAVSRLRAAARNKAQNDARATGEALIVTDTQAAESDFDSEWPS